MSKVKIQGNASGTGVVTLTAPNTNTDRTITLPDDTQTLIGTNASGNVGIGTNSTFGKASINSNGAPATSGNMSTGLTVHNASGGTAINIGTYDAGGYSYIQSAYVNSAGTTRDLAFLTGATERMRINSAGIVTMPNQPAFSANNSNTGIANTTLVFNQANVNVGSHYSTSTGRFTAPVDGQYMFTFYGMSDGNANMRLTIQINGAVYTGGEHLGGVGYTNGVTYSQVELNTILTLSASDYVSIFNNSGYSNIHPDHSKFSGHLIG